MSTNLTMMSDILFRDNVDSDRLRVAVSGAFFIAPELVAVADAAGIDPIPGDARVVMLHESQDLPGDFPIWYGMSVDPALTDRVEGAVESMARILDMVLLSDAEDERDMTLYLPDGSGHVVRLEQGEDDAFRITSEMRQLIDRVTHRAPGAGNSPDISSRATRVKKAVAS